MTLYKGDLIVRDRYEQFGQVTGTTYVKSGGHLIMHGQLSGGLIIEHGGEAIIHGQVSRNVINHGQITLHGQVAGCIIGNQPINQTGPGQIVGKDLEVPTRGTTTSYIL